MFNAAQGANGASSANSVDSQQSARSMPNRNFAQSASGSSRGMAPPRNQGAQQLNTRSVQLQPIDPSILRARPSEEYSAVAVPATLSDMRANLSQVAGRTNALEDYPIEQLQGVEVTVGTAHTEPPHHLAHFSSRPVRPSPLYRLGPAHPDTASPPPAPQPHHRQSNTAELHVQVNSTEFTQSSEHDNPPTPRERSTENRPW